MAAAVALGQACRSKLDVKSKRGAEGAAEAFVPPAEPVPQPPPPSPPVVTPPSPQVVGPTQRGVKNAFSTKGSRSHFQTREVIAFEITDEVFEGADSWQLVGMDMAAPDDDAKATMIMEGDVPSGAALTAGSDRMVMVLYPGSPERALLKIGPNRVRVRTNIGSYAELDIVQEDFAVFDFTYLTTVGGVQIARAEDGRQVQGWQETLASPVVTAETPCEEGVGACGATTLTHGLFDMINPR